MDAGCTVAPLLSANEQSPWRYKGLDLRLQNERTTPWCASFRGFFRALNVRPIFPQPVVSIFKKNCCCRAMYFTLSKPNGASSKDGDRKSLLDLQVGSLSTSKCHWKGDNHGQRPARQYGPMQESWLCRIASEKLPHLLGNGEDLSRSFAACASFCLNFAGLGCDRACTCWSVRISALVWAWPGFVKYHCILAPEFHHWPRLRLSLA